MTARQQTVNAIARRLASLRGFRFNKLPEPSQLAWEKLADDIIGMIEHKMSSQSKQLSELIREVWNLPA